MEQNSEIVSFKEKMKDKPDLLVNHYGWTQSETVTSAFQSDMTPKHAPLTLIFDVNDKTPFDILKQITQIK